MVDWLVECIGIRIFGVTDCDWLDDDANRIKRYFFSRCVICTTLLQNAWQFKQAEENPKAA